MIFYCLEAGHASLPFAGLTTYRVAWVFVFALGSDDEIVSSRLALRDLEKAQPVVLVIFDAVDSARLAGRQADVMRLYLQAERKI